MISIVTPSVRPEMLEMVAKCLKRQTFTKWEWLIVGPNMNLSFLPKLGLYAPSLENKIGIGCFQFIREPKRRENDFYNLNKAWNTAFKNAKGQLIVSIVDGLWFPPDTLERLWTHFENDPTLCIGAIGHQYEKIENGRPEGLKWVDPRIKKDQQFYEIDPIDMEWCIASIPLQALIGVGGIDEEYDKVAAISEKETNCRMAKLGYKFYLDQSIEYRAIYHPRLNDRWDEFYQKGCDLFAKHLREINEGKRLKLNYL